MEATQKLLFVVLPLAVGVGFPLAWDNSKQSEAAGKCPSEQAGLDLVLSTQCLKSSTKKKCEDAEYAFIACVGKQQA